MKAKWFGIAGVFMIVFSLVLSSVAFAGGACCAYSGGSKSGDKTAQEEGGQASEAE